MWLSLCCESLFTQRCACLFICLHMILHTSLVTYISHKTMAGVSVLIVEHYPKKQKNNLKTSALSRQHFLHSSVVFIIRVWSDSMPKCVRIYYCYCVAMKKMDSGSFSIMSLLRGHGHLISSHMPNTNCFMNHALVVIFRSTVTHTMCHTVNIELLLQVGNTLVGRTLPFVRCWHYKHVCSELVKALSHSTLIISPKW